MVVCLWTTPVLLVGSILLEKLGFLSFLPEEFGWMLQVVDSAVLRFSNAVTHFSPGSYPSRPLQNTSIGNVFMAGDWVRGLDHGANGLSQERAYITGLSSANLVVQLLGHGEIANILPVEADEPHVATSKGINRTVQGLVDALPFRFAGL